MTAFSRTITIENDEVVPDFMQGKEAGRIMLLKDRSTLLALSALTVALGSSCAAIQPSATPTSGGAPSHAEAQNVPYNGPKARITIAAFTDKSVKGYSEIGAGMTDMFTSALFNTNRFIVLERNERGEKVREQDLAVSSRINKGSEAVIGTVEGAELLVVGAITAFEPSAGVIDGSMTTHLAGAGSVDKTAHLALDIRIIDAKTSRILATRSIEGTAQESGGLAGIVVGPLARGFGAFAKTPMEKAIRVCLQTAVNFIVQQTPALYYHY